jgi:hypothetical protein
MIHAVAQSHICQLSMRSGKLSFDSAGFHADRYRGRNWNGHRQPAPSPPAVGRPQSLTRWAAQRRPSRSLGGGQALSATRKCPGSAKGGTSVRLNQRMKGAPLPH